MGTKVTSEVNYQELYVATTATPTKMSLKKKYSRYGFSDVFCTVAHNEHIYFVVARYYKDYKL